MIGDGRLPHNQTKRTTDVTLTHPISTKPNLEGDQCKAGQREVYDSESAYRFDVDVFYWSLVIGRFLRISTGFPFLFYF